MDFEKVSYLPLYIAVSTNFLNIGSAAFAPVSNLPSDFGSSYPI